MQDIKSKIDKFSKFFAKKELGITVYYGDSNSDDFLKGKSEFLPLKILKATPLFEKEISEDTVEKIIETDYFMLLLKSVLFWKKMRF